MSARLMRWRVWQGALAHRRLTHAVKQHGPAPVQVQGRPLHAGRRPSAPAESRHGQQAAALGEAGSAGSDPVDRAGIREDIRTSVRALCRRFPGQYWRRMEDERSYPAEFVAELQSAGLLALLIPERYGGSGLQLREACVALEEIHRSGCNGGAAHAQMYTMGSVLKHGSEEQKQRLLPKIASGELRLQAFGVSEPNSGTDTLSLETTARLSDDGSEWAVHGQKMWTSRAEHSDLMLLLARTGGSDAPRAKALSTFLVDMRAAQEAGSMTIRPVDTMINHSTCEVFFDGVRVPRDGLVGKVGDGLKNILSGMNAERVLIAAECIGDGRFFIDRAVDYAKNRKVFGRPIGQNQGIQFPIAEAHASIEAAALMVERAADLFEAGEDCGAEANMAKMLAAEASWKAGEVCMQTHGGYAFAREFDVERKWRETRLYRIAPISTNLVLSYIGEKVLGLPKSY